MGSGMSDQAYIPGEVARISVAVTNTAGAAADPGALRLKTKSPAGALVTHTYGGSAVVVKDGPNGGAAEGVITVQKSRVI
jgi:hypothetical protein